jgi:hypothetical protein
MALPHIPAGAPATRRSKAATATPARLTISRIQYADVSLLPAVVLSSEPLCRCCSLHGFGHLQRPRHLSGVGILRLQRRVRCADLQFMLGQLLGLRRSRQGLLCPDLTLISQPTCKFCTSSSTCSSHGNCDASAFCVCTGNYAGTSCNQCNPGYFGSGCNPCPGGATNPCDSESIDR